MKNGSMVDRIGMALARGWVAMSSGRARLDDEFEAGYRCGYRAAMIAAREEQEHGRVQEASERQVAGERKAS